MKKPTTDPPLTAMTMAELVATVAVLQADVKQLKAQRGPLAPELIMLKTAPRGSYSFEAVRIWWHRGHITAVRDGSRLMTTAASVAERVSRLTRSK